MPFESKAQERYMFANHPKIAAEFAANTPDMKKLPEKVSEPTPDRKIEAMKMLIEQQKGK